MKVCPVCKEPMQVNFYGTGTCSLDCHDKAQDKKIRDLTSKVAQMQHDFKLIRDDLRRYPRTADLIAVVERHL